jgi:predicted metalloprotease with PDZ domain
VLDEVAPTDWPGFFRERLNSTDVHAPLGGIERSGWKLAYDAERSQVIKDREGVFKRLEMGYSLGLRVSPDGVVADVIPGMPASRAGLGPGMTIVAVDGRAFSPDALRDAVRAARAATPIRLVVDNEGTLSDYSVDDHGGEQYPHLVRHAAGPDLLSRTLAPLTSKP